MTAINKLPKLLLTSLFFLLLSLTAFAQEIDHSAHMAMMKNKSSIVQSHANYTVPDVVLFNQYGEKVNLKEFLSRSEPLALNFIFTTCTTICPILTMSFKQMQKNLGSEADNLQIISITIDPEYDTPAVLEAHAKKVRATKNWTFLTGNRVTIEQIEKAFNTSSSGKMDNKPVYLFKSGPDKDWIRVDGLASGRELADIYRISDLF